MIDKMMRARTAATTDAQPRAAAMIDRRVGEDRQREMIGAKK
jgi:hypothetical protein